MNKISLKSLLVIVFGIITAPIYAQELNHEDHHKYELGIANSLVYIPNDKESAYGLHIHLVRNIEHSKLGVGIAYERIFDEHGHNTIGLVGSYNLFDSLHISFTPGVTFEDNLPSDLKFAFHAETSYDFKLGNIHLGPLVEFAFDPEDYHFSLGLHIGYGF